MASTKSDPFAEAIEIFAQASERVYKARTQVRNLLVPDAGSKRMREYFDGDLSELVEQLDWYADALSEARSAGRSSTKAPASKPAPKVKAPEPKPVPSRAKQPSRIVRGGARVVPGGSKPQAAAPAVKSQPDRVTVPADPA